MEAGELFVMKLLRKLDEIRQATGRREFRWMTKPPTLSPKGISCIDLTIGFQP
jgi:hypothetical protein